MNKNVFADFALKKLYVFKTYKKTNFWTELIAKFFFTLKLILSIIRLFPAIKGIRIGTKASEFGIKNY